MRPGGVITEPQLAELADEIFAAAGWQGIHPPTVVDRRVSRSIRARADGRPGRQSIRVNPCLLIEPEPVRRGTIAHEVAHLDGIRAEHWVSALVGTLCLWAAAIAMVTVATMAGSTTVVSLWFLAGIVAALAALRLSVIPQRRCERAADRQSAAYVDLEVVVSTLQYLHRQTPAVLRMIAACGFETHPSPRQRLRSVLAAVTSQQT